ncbi:MAG: DNA primase small subunit domain-containing protein [Promethearchaeota archaeon]
MSENSFLKMIFQAYYKENHSNIPIVNMFSHREFGFLHWQKQGMMRHIGFNDFDNLKKYLMEHSPRHVYYSGALYLDPDNLEMGRKKYQGCDLIIDIDVDHFDTPCKNDHDFWYCKECGTSGNGLIKKCPKCGKLKFKTLNWICEICLEIAKKEIFKLINDFLIPDFGIKEKEINIAFSGHRGYHLKVENKKLRSLTSEQRREIIDYLTGENISLEILGLREIGGNIYGLSKHNIGWSQKIVNKLETILQNYSDLDLELLLKKFGFRTNIIKSFLNSRDYFLEIISNDRRNLWNIEGFGIQSWKVFLQGIIHEIGAEIDEPVTIDIHRLIRYPGSLHGKTGFRVQELTLSDLDDFNPMDESSSDLDPIVFKSEITHKIEITEPFVPPTKIKGSTYGPYEKGQIYEVPHHIAIFLLCKGVAKKVLS